MDLNEIRRAQMIAGENAVIENLRRKGLIKDENEDVFQSESYKEHLLEEDDDFEDVDNCHYCNNRYCAGSCCDDDGF